MITLVIANGSNVLAALPSDVMGRVRRTEDVLVLVVRSNCFDCIRCHRASSALSPTTSRITSTSQTVDRIWSQRGRLRLPRRQLCWRPPPDCSRRQGPPMPWVELPATRAYLCFPSLGNWPRIRLVVASFRPCSTSNDDVASRRSTGALHALGNRPMAADPPFTTDPTFKGSQAFVDRNQFNDLRPSVYEVLERRSNLREGV